MVLFAILFVYLLQNETVFTRGDIFQHFSVTDKNHLPHSLKPVSEQMTGCICDLLTLGALTFGHLTHYIVCHLTCPLLSGGASLWHGCWLK